MLMANAMRGGSLSQEVLQYAASFGDTVLNALKDYCNVHKELIPYINDWKYIIHSLVDTGYTSWLKGDGRAYINTNIPVTTHANIKLLAWNNGSLRTQNLFGERTVGEQLSTLLFLFWSPSRENFSAYSMRGTNTISHNQTLEHNSKVEFTLTDNISKIKIKENEWVKVLEQTEVLGDKDLTFYIFSHLKNKSTLKADASISYVEYEYGGDNHKYIPYYNKNTERYGMLDVFNVTDEPSESFYDSVYPEYSFSWILTDQYDEIVKDL